MRYLLVLSFLVLCTGLQAQVTVVNGASFRADQPVAAGSWVSAFGAFTGVASTQNAAIPLPKDLGGVSVTVDGVAAPLNYVSATQFNFLIPYQTAPGLRTVAVKTSTATVDGTVRVITAGPGLFLKDTSVPPRGAILNQDNSENASDRPAIRGQVISIYATGPGAIAQQVQDGAAAPRSPLVLTKSTPQVYVGGVESQVQFSGLAPDFVGLWQINVTVPNLSFLSGRVPVKVFMDGVDSNEVTVFVAQ